MYLQPILIKFFFSDNLILLDQLFIYCIDIRSIRVTRLLLFFLFPENVRNLFVLGLVSLLFRKNIIICHLRQYEVTAFFCPFGMFEWIISTWQVRHPSKQSSLRRIYFGKVFLVKINGGSCFDAIRPMPEIHII